ncbi:tRNA (adenosine(37)-N6)-threonylcarbamoyltransferase complex ATPase subunit type 1 TsaE [Anaerotignum sp. MB30-C6]|uniref:tRNA (adenosine(37)-N6)-threonylcarbamoyltransferase complex ATPase subunit type 1 TsaE n=1 Tax=Anaerotignum sp. MB30-C6 TaxID=3070814 RepID=UPI0027DD16BE|nr:tRNA (adenosine(37)-N6)-threonylcarbamoyltransferase complex ATPase subunit type 1 TsaE [Anaerotignum sp. MB30-C6]WMI80801.1 tRNA (adenosine(37)-N6)-threonylcarbamoyltransferase complex ATPase subunit type 1 TsaE [Anaerotignum sp. MB30-C6]
MKKVWETFSPQETEAIGEKMGQEAVSGQVYSLDGDLGVGKTVFSKGFARGLGITEHVTSPTFTIINEYMGRIPLYHFDVYRISCEEEMDDTGYEDYFYGEGISLVEWATLIPNLMPKDAIHITIEKDFKKGDDYRRITVCQGENA